MTLYHLNMQMLEILDMAETGEFDEDLIKDTLEGLEGEIEKKLDDYGVVVNELSADVAKIDQELQRLTAQKKTLINSIEYLKRTVKETLIRLDKRKVSGDRFTWTIAKNGGKVPVVYDDSFDVMALPPELQIWEVKPDKEAIRKELDAGNEVPGAHFGERGEGLRLR